MRMGFSPSRGLHVQAYFSRPRFACGELQRPNGWNLRALIHTFKPFLGFRNRLDRRDPNLLGVSGFDRGRDILPLIHQS